MHYLYLARYIYKILRLIIIAITLAYVISCIWYAIATADLMMMEITLLMLMKIQIFISFILLLLLFELKD